MHVYSLIWEHHLHHPDAIVSDLAVKAYFEQKAEERAAQMQIFCVLK